ncbi:hypothetical protein LOK49_LG01G01532 [Camellia lanceoleosa]|uniref:Uncharacterized protein n=1 Tax=Camellia lanceoleosa TaxID=1840588 RepID=A0ACC0IX83_9ERIC|nr:hypothetical protein LOK49_LG01G01532 [Camellia lanceoleosa]
MHAILVAEECCFIKNVAVLTDTDHCYCVILNADGGAAFPSEKTAQDCSSSDISSLKINTSSGKTEKTKVKRSKEYAFIQYTSQDDALLALESMDHKRNKSQQHYLITLQCP